MASLDIDVELVRCFLETGTERLVEILENLSLQMGSYSLSMTIAFQDA